MVPLSVCSHYSFLWGTASPRQIVKAARQLGHQQIALSDTDNLCGLWDFLKACDDYGIKPIVGAQITDVAGGSRALCLVENQTGYENLCRLISKRHTDKRFSLKTAGQQLGDGLFFLLRDMDLMTAWHDAGLDVAAAMPRKALTQSAPLFAEAKRRGIPIAASSGSVFLTSDSFAIHRLLRAIGQNTTLGRLCPSSTAPSDAWLASKEEYERRFAVCPEVLRESSAIAERLDFTGPDFSWVMPPWDSQNNGHAPEVLRKRAFEGACRRYGQDLSESVVERLIHELKIIIKMGFASYFLVVQGIVGASPRTCGRGSGAASLVAYCLGITNVCPIKHNLYFERFLNEGRKDPPDIDVDFAWDERDRVIEKVFADYPGQCAMVSTHVLFQAAMAIRETAKVYGIPEGEFGRWAKRIGRHGLGLDEDDSALPERAAKVATELPKPWPEILLLASKIVGVPRCLSVHPGGVIITPGPISSYAPVEIAPKGVPIIQWDKDGAEYAGLVKIDLLGNRSLGVIRDALAGVRHDGNLLDEATWEPEDDFQTQQALALGNTMGCFYIESPAMRLLQKKSNVGDFEHLVIHSSIIRPAANDCIREYLRRLHGGRWNPISPLLEDILCETYGIMVYQEDVSRAAVTLAGFDAAQAESLRKVMSKKDNTRVMEEFGASFFEGAKQKGVSQKAASEAWEMMMSFSGYSFCKPHSASYARVSFQAAWLKVHYPAQFMAAVISNGGGFYDTFAYVSEARRMGLEILPPCVNKSSIKWCGSNNEIRVGLCAIKALGEKTARQIVEEREKLPFSGMGDFLGRVRPSVTETKALALCGALDNLNANASRAQLLWEAASIQGRQKEMVAKPVLFECEESRPSLPPIPKESQIKKLRREFGVLGFLCDGHPIELFGKALEKFAPTVKAKNLDQHTGKRVTVAGWLITGKTVVTKTGSSMNFLTFEDETGTLEATVFPKAYKRFCLNLDYNRPYILKGRVEEDFGAVTLTVDEFLRP